MSLQVWLPLNGDLRNNGLSNVTVTNNGATVDNAGKIGKCYYFNGSSHIRISLPPELTSIKNSSVCAWVKSTGSTVALGGISSNSTYAYPMMTLYTSGWQFAGTSAYKYISGGSIANSGVWHHVCCAAGDDIVTTYLDGVVVASKTYSEIGSDKWILNSSINFIEIGCDHPGGDEYLTGYVNDFRVYNHCLSPKEVKLISQGLVCHYQLNQSFSINNLVRNATYVAYNNYSGSGTTATLLQTGEVYDGCPVYRLTYTPNDTSINNVKTSLANHGIYGFRKTFSANTKYCFWILWKPISHSDTICGGTASNIGGWTAIPTEKFVNGWNIVGQYRNGSVTTDKIDNIFTSFKTPSAVSGEPIIIDFCCPHLVEGYDYILPENEYQLNNENVVYDSSGYNYHGKSIATSLLISSDTPRNQFSTNFNGTDDGIIIENLPLSNIINTAITYSFWIKPNGENGARSIYFGSYGSGNSWSIEKNTSNRIRLYWMGSPDESSSTFTISDGQWQHICIVKNGTNDIKVYFNGEQKWTSTTTHSDLSFPTTYRIGRDTRSNDGTPYKGLMSDFRIYATALSAEDILALYNTPVSIANTGTMLTQGEYVEVIT